MKKVTFALIIAMGALVLAFQNCSNGTDFSSANQLVAKSDAVIDVGTDVVPGDDATPVDETDDVASVPVSPPKRPSTSQHDRDCDDENHHHENNTSSSKSELKFVCVLQGPGSSVKLGLQDGELSGKVATPKDVCMTENACLNIVSKSFSVKGAEKRGFCPDKNKSVVPMTDKEIAAALELAELSRKMNERLKK